MGLSEPKTNENSLAEKIRSLIMYEEYQEYEKNKRDLAKRIETLAKDVLTSKHEGRELFRTDRLFGGSSHYIYDSEALIYTGNGRVCSFVEYKKPGSERLYKEAVFCGNISDLDCALSTDALLIMGKNIERIAADK